MLQAFHFTLLASCLWIPAFSFAQPTFERTYGGSSVDWGNSVHQTMDGGFIIAGLTMSFGAGNADLYLIRTDLSGDTLWTRTYGGTAWDEGYSVRETSDGGFIIGGLTSSFGSGLGDFYLMRTDSLGDTLWSKTYGGTLDEHGYSVQETSDGGFILAGETESYGAGLADVYLVRTNSFGDTLWTKTYGGTDSDVGFSVQETSDGGYIITGWTWSFGAGSVDVYLIRTNSSGDTLWTRTYGDSLDDFGTSVQQTSDGGYIITGWTTSFGAGLSDIHLLRTDSSGNILWTKIYGGINWDDGWFVQETFDGGFVITGYTESFGSGSGDLYLIRTDSLGDTLWTRTYGGTDLDEGYYIKQTSDGGFIITGYTYSIGAGLSDVYIIKTNGNGMVGIEESNDDYRTRNIEYRLLQNRPNPFNKLTSISYELRAPEHTTLKIYDITGRLVETLVDDHQKSGVYKVQWEGKDQSSGVYFYKLTSSDFTATKKLILLK